MTQALNKKLLAIGGVGLAAAAIAFGLGFDRAAAGAIAGSLVGMFNCYLLHAAASQKSEGDQPKALAVNLFLRSLMRMGISMIALLVALRFGVEFLIGALAGILSETATYTGDAVRLMLKRWR